jgi:hypothetical protein
MVRDVKALSSKSLFLDALQRDKKIHTVSKRRQMRADHVKGKNADPKQATIAVAIEFRLIGSLFRTL